jgi:glycosyltransferase involved in cell wall biosynthesis/uncharacterized membrane protein YkoI
MRLGRRIVANVIRAALARYVRGGRSEAGAGAGTVSILLMHAWGMGGTIRTCMQVAGYLAGDRDVELLSVVRRRDEPHFELPAGVRVRAIDDQRAGAPVPPAARVLRRVARRLPSVFFSTERASASCTLWTDLCIAHTLRRRHAGVLMGTRASLNLIVADVARPSLVRIAQEHMHFAARRPELRETIARRYRGVDAVVVLTEQDAGAYREALDDAVPVVCIPNAVTPPGGPASALTGPRVLAAGRLTPQKGFDLLIRAFARVVAVHPEWTLRICGGGRSRRALERLIAQEGLAGHVELAGPVTGLREELEQASMYVLSSRFEGLPLVLLEAMSKGVPVVSFDCPTGPRELVDDHVNGILVPPRDVAGLARGMLELIEDPELRRRCGHAAEGTAARHGLAVIGPRWDDLLDGLASGPPGRFNVLSEGGCHGAIASNRPKGDLVQTRKFVAAGTLAAGLALATGVAFGAGGAAAPSRLDDGKSLLGQAKITEAEAIAAAQTAASGPLNEVDLEPAAGRLVFNVDVGNSDVKVDATTGEVVSAGRDD